MKSLAWMHSNLSDEEFFQGSEISNARDENHPQYVVRFHFPGEVENGWSGKAAVSEKHRSLLFAQGSLRPFKDD